MDEVTIVHRSAEPSVLHRLYCRYIFYALYTNHMHLPKRDAGKFCRWEFCPNPQPTTFHTTTKRFEHVAHRSLPSLPIAKHAHQHWLLKAMTTHQQTQPATTSGGEPTSTHTSLTGATSLTATWQLNNERRPKIVVHHNITVCNYIHPTMFILAESQDHQSTQQ